MRSVTPWLKRGVAFVAAAPLALASSLALGQNPDSTTLPNGAELSVEIFNPAQDEEFKVPANADGSAGGTIDVDTDGEASVGEGEPNIHVTFVMDVSGSTSNPEIDCLGGFVLDCEQDAIINVINDANFQSVLDTGLSVFADSGAFADMTPAGGDDPLTSVFADAITVVNSTFSVFGGDGGVADFTNKIVGVGTNYTAGLQAANNSVSASAAGTKRVFFLSDGIAGAGDLGDFDAAVAALGVRIDSFAIGASAACGDTGTISLQRMADDSGGTCTELPDPADIVTTLPDLISTSLDSVVASIDGVPVIPTNTVPGLPADGPLTAAYDATILGLGVGDYVVDADADGSDDAGADSVTANIDIHILQLIANPFTASNELSEDNEHTVFGQILGGTGPDRNIDFLVSAGPNAGPGGSSLATPGGAAVSFMYSVDGNECSSLGTDTINVSTSIAGMLDSVDLSKDWVDTIPPEATCVETENPHGNKKPKAPGNGNQAQNQDGFYLIEATDNLSGASCAALELFLLDDGSGTVFGPFDVGTEIKWTEEPPPTPIEMKKIGGNGANAQSKDTDYHIIAWGDAVLTAVDGAGNTSTDVNCLVPPPPK